MSPLLIKISKDLKLARCYPRRFTFHVAHPSRSIETRLLPTLTRSYPRHFTFYVAEPLSSIRVSPLLIKISKDFATLWTTIDPIGNVALFAALTASLTRAERRRTALRATLKR